MILDRYDGLDPSNKGQLCYDSEGEGRRLCEKYERFESHLKKKEEKE